MLTMSSRSFKQTRSHDRGHFPAISDKLSSSIFWKANGAQLGIYDLRVPRSKTGLTIVRQTMDYIMVCLLKP